MAWRRFFGVILVVLCGVVGSQAQERFDNEVRDDMFRAFAGNEAAMRNALSARNSRRTRTMRKRWFGAERRAPSKPDNHFAPATSRAAGNWPPAE